MEFRPRRHPPTSQIAPSQPPQPTATIQHKKPRRSYQKLLPQPLFPSLRSIKRRWFVIVAVFVVLALAIIWSLLSHHTPHQLPPQQQPYSRLNKTTGTLERGTPNYPVYTPNGKSIDEYGGWTRVSPPDRDPVYAYTDTISGARVTVSQQALPSDFNEDTDTQVEQLAIGYSANNHISINGMTIYLGTSAKGPQSVIFAKSKTLILIKSSMKLSNDTWTQYINSLK